MSLSSLTSSDVVPHGCSPYDYALNVAVLSFSCSALVAEVMSFLFHNIQIVRQSALLRHRDFSACKVSASGILQGHGTALARIIFQDFGVRLLLVQILVPPKVKNYPAISCLKCLLLALYWQRKKSSFRGLHISLTI